MTQTQKANIAAVRSACTRALSDAMSHPDVLHLKRVRSETNHETIWRRRRKIAELAVEAVVEEGLDRDVAIVAVPKTFEAICAGTDQNLIQQLVVI
jgi:ABC-type xylose transport system substrate-binding protein